MERRTGRETTAAAAVSAVIETGAAHYERARMLPRLIAVDPALVADTGAGATRQVLARLEGALREQRQLGRAGHWRYDLNRHIGLTQARLAERRHLAALGEVP